jgi:putative membrane protein
MLIILLTLLLSSLAVWVSAQILPGVRLEGYPTALVVAIVLGIVNAFIRPLLLLLTLPINILTLGLFTIVIMGFCAWLVSLVVPGFGFASFWWAMGFALVFAIINSFLNALSP